MILTFFSFEKSGYKKVDSIGRPLRVSQFVARFHIWYLNEGRYEGIMVGYSDGSAVGDVLGSDDGSCVG